MNSKIQGHQNLYKIFKEKELKKKITQMSLIRIIPLSQKSHWHKNINCHFFLKRCSLVTKQLTTKTLSCFGGGSKTWFNIDLWWGYEEKQKIYWWGFNKWEEFKQLNENRF